MKVVILGGGIGGLSAGVEASKFCRNVLLVEKECVLGGLSSSYDIDGYKIPKYFRHVIGSDKVTLNLLKKLKIFNKFIKKKVKFGIYFVKHNKIFQLNVFKLLSFKPMSLYDKLKFGLLCTELLLKDPNFIELDKIDAEQWLRKKTSENVVEIFSKMIAKHKFAVPFKRISAAWMASRLKLELSKSKYIYYPKSKEGFDIFINKLKDRIVGDILLNTTVKKIKMNGSKVTEIVIDNKKISIKENDLVINTLPVPVFLNLCKGIQKSEKEKLKKLKYAGNVCVCFGCEKKLTDYYWVNFVDDLPFGTLIDHNNLYDKYPWDIIYLSNYVNPKHQFLKLPDKKIVMIYLKCLEKIIKRKIKPIWFRVSKTPYATPIYELNFFEKIVKNEKFKNLAFVGAYTSFPTERVMGASIKAGIEAVRLKLQS